VLGRFDSATYTGQVVRTAISAVFMVLALTSTAAQAGVISANPSNYRSLARNAPAR
jgi:hypothetical protein